MKTIYILIFVQIFLLSCASKFRTSEFMLPDGNTWSAVLTASYVCKDSTFLNLKDEQNKKCLAQLKPLFEEHGVELCGVKPNRIFNCGLGDSEEGKRYSCYIECFDKSKHYNK